MKRPLVKICGIIRVEDGLRALECGADLLGFIRYPKSPRYRSVEDCVATLEKIRRGSSKPFDAVGVYVDAPVSEILRELELARFDRIQLHGSETMEVVRELPVPVIKALKVSGSDLSAQADQYPGLDLLTDAPDDEKHGGTGKSYDLGQIEELVRSRRVFVAGGVTKDNVRTIVTRLRPYGLDISSGVESSPGLKDSTKLEAFFNALGRTDD